MKYVVKRNPKAKLNGPFQWAICRGKTVIRPYHCRLDAQLTANEMNAGYAQVMF